MSGEFLAGAEMSTRAEMASMDNKLTQAKMLSQKASLKEANTSQQLKKVSMEFESIFLNYMLSQMRKTVPDDPLMEKSNAKEIYESMYDESISKELAKAGGIGLAGMLYKQLSADAATQAKREALAVAAYQPALPGNSK